MANTSGSSGSASCIFNLTGQMPSSVSPSSQEKTPLYRLAKLLNQSAKIQNQSTPKDDAPRRLSWERLVVFFFLFYLCCVNLKIQI